VSDSLVCLVAPAAEPVSLDEFKSFLEIPESDTSRDDKLTSLLLAARMLYERDTRTKLVTQTWLLRRDSFPGISVRYDGNGYPEIFLPFPPFHSVVSVKYVDVAGAVQPLTRDLSYGNQLATNFYGYQLEPGGGMKPARILPTWARPWPPERMVPASTLIAFRCGFGGPVTVSLPQGSAALSSPGFVFNPDDAPQLAGDKGTKVSIPGAGIGGGVLATYVASVDANGVATLADQAVVSVASAQAWVGDLVPEPARLSIMFHAQFFFEQGAVVDQALPRVVEALRNRNLIS